VIRIEGLRTLHGIDYCGSEFVLRLSGQRHDHSQHGED